MLRQRQWPKRLLLAAGVVLLFTRGVPAQTIPAPAQQSVAGQPQGQETTPSPYDLLRRAIANQDPERRKEYTYFEHRRGFSNYKRSATDTYEIMVINGTPYRRHIEHDDKPLPPSEQKDEPADLKQQRDRTFVEEVLRRYPHSASIYNAPDLELPLKQVPELFALQMAGREILDGRDNYIIEVTPNLNHRAANDDEENARNLVLRIWVDVADTQIRKVEARVVGEGFSVREYRVWPAPPSTPSSQRGLDEGLRTLDSTLRGVYLPGTVITQEWKKINGEVWLPTSSLIRGEVRSVWALSKTKRAAVDQEITYYGYQKFRADTKILPQ